MRCRGSVGVKNHRGATRVDGGSSGGFLGFWVFADWSQRASPPPRDGMANRPEGPYQKVGCRKILPSASGPRLKQLCGQQLVIYVMICWILLIDDSVALVPRSVWAWLAGSAFPGWSFRSEQMAALIWSRARGLNFIQPFGDSQSYSDCPGQDVGDIRVPRLRL